LCRLTALIALVLVLALPTMATASPAGVRHAICVTFGRHCGEALRVAWCESRFNVWARNGQYVGIFQMGSHERPRRGLVTVES
jgi:hypothetical protein